MNGLTLAVDTSSNLGRMVVFDRQRIIAHLGLDLPKTHSETLLNRLDFLLRECRLDLSQFDHLMAVLGPGSFTGTRIGTVVIKTLAYHYKIPVLGLSSLLLLMMDGVRQSPNSGDCIGLIPGIRDELYFGRYRNHPGTIPILIEETLILKAELPERISTGEAVFTRSEKLAADWNQPFPLSLVRGFAADWPLLLSDTDRLTIPLSDFQPLYLRESEAELVHRRQKKKKYQLYIENLWNEV